MKNQIINVTEQEFQVILNNNKYSLNGLENYEIVPDFTPTGNKVIDQCLHSRIKECGSTLYFGGHTLSDCYSFQNKINKVYNTTSLFVDGYRAVLTDNDTYNIYTYCEGDILVESFTVSYTHLRAHETRHDLVCRLLLEK